MKKHLHNSLRALFLSLAVLLSLPMLAEKVEIDGINYELDAETYQATVIAKSSGKYSGEVVIPESVKHEDVVYSVTGIGMFAFERCSGLTSVTIGNDVTSIGEYAFSGCRGLTSVTIGNGVTSIRGGAFRDCLGLTSVHISDIAAWCNIYFDGYTSTPLCYAHYLYLNGEEVKDMVIPNSVTSIGEHAFYGCSGLTSVTIPNSVTSIGNWAFSFCSGLSSIVVENGNPVYDSRNNCNAIIETETNTLHSGCRTTIIPNSVTSLGDWAFYGCSGLTSVTIPNSVTSIGDRAFDSCSGLTSVIIPNSVERIGGSAFYDCDGLTSVTIPNSVTSIGSHAFYGCSGLTSVTIPNSVTSIESYVFYFCSALTSVTIPNSVTSIGDWAFSNCYNLLDFYCYAENVPSTNNSAFKGAPIAKATLHVPATSIESYKATKPWSGFGKIVVLAEEETGVDELKSENGSVKTAVYDLSGRRVQNAQNGVCIQNGKVVMVR